MLGALIQLRGSPPITVPTSKNVGDHVLARYPVIVCSTFDRFRSTDLEGSQLKPIASNFLLEVDYAWVNTANRPVREYALVDVIALPLLGDFLHAIDKEVEAVATVFGGD